MSALLVSVRNAAEAEEAIAGGAGLIDLKEPARGSLGPLHHVAATDVIRAVAGRCPVSIALGELREYGPAARWLAGLKPVSLLKGGLSFTSQTDWRQTLLRVRTEFSYLTSAGLVAVAYADWERAGAPDPYDVMEFAIRHRFAAFLIDTWGKDACSLLDWLTEDELGVICRRFREAGVSVALAGSLGTEEIRSLLPAGPDWFAVRGAACDGGRNGTVTRERVAELVALLSPPC